MLAEGCALGYRKGVNGGTWIARYRDTTGRQHYEALGPSDDIVDANDRTIFFFAHAQQLAQVFFQRKQQTAAQGYIVADVPITVTEALEDYFAAYKRRSGKAIGKMRSSARTHIAPWLGSIAIHKLNRKLLEQ